MALFSKEKPPAEPTPFFKEAKEQKEFSMEAVTELGQNGYLVDVKMERTKVGMQDLATELDLTMDSPPSPDQTNRFQHYQENLTKAEAIIPNVLKALKDTHATDAEYKSLLAAMTEAQTTLPEKDPQRLLLEAKYKALEATRQTLRNKGEKAMIPDIAHHMLTASDSKDTFTTFIKQYQEMAGQPGFQEFSARNQAKFEALKQRALAGDKFPDGLPVDDEMRTHENITLATTKWLPYLT